MTTFRVWVRPSDYEFLVCVDGMANAHWLIDQLGAGSCSGVRSRFTRNRARHSARSKFQTMRLPFSKFQSCSRQCRK